MTKTINKLDAAKIERIANVLKAVAHPLRLTVIEELGKRQKMTVSEIVEKVGAEQSLVSHHLTKMKDKGILTSVRDGKNIYYQLADDHLTSIFSCIDQCSFI